jgi:hypothetical protein
MDARLSVITRTKIRADKHAADYICGASPGRDHREER